MQTGKIIVSLHEMQQLYFLVFLGAIGDNPTVVLAGLKEESRNS